MGTGCNHGGDKTAIRALDGNLEDPQLVGPMDGKGGVFAATCQKEV